jgi:hypothetical protein
MWWIAFALLVASDKSQQAKNPEETEETMPPNIGREQPRWPSWSEFRASPSLFLVAFYCALLYGIVLVLIWPAIPVHKIWLWKLRRKNKDNAA